MSEQTQSPEAFADLPTPCLVLDRPVLQRNIDRMKARAKSLGVRLRPHMKTAKSIDVARLVRDDDNAGITVSTLKEAEYFVEHGITDVLYAVGIVPAKLDRVAQLCKRGARIQLILDSLDAARAVAQFATERDVTLDVLIEIDTDGHRAGLAPDDPMLPNVGELLSSSAAIQLLGVVTHAGGSYNCRTPEAITAHAEQERSLCVKAAEVLRGHSIPCRVVSVGSTPTAVFAKELSGVTEMRPGNFVFYDLFQAGLGVCSREDISIRVLCSVVGHNRNHNRFFTDAGGLALSKDLGTSSQELDQRFGMVLTEPVGGAASDDTSDDYLVVDANQEHGVVSTRSGRPVDFDRFPIGSKLLVLPVHSCMTSAAHDRYYVVDADNGDTPDEVVATWDRCNGW